MGRGFFPYVDDGDWLDDPALLDRLVTEKLKREPESIAAEGWRWIEVAVEFPYGHCHGMGWIDSQAAEFSDDAQKQLAELRTAYDALSEEYQHAEELPEAVDARLGELEIPIASFEDRPVTFDPAEIARAGVFVSLRPDGKLAIEGGYVRPEDERKDGEEQQGDEGEDGASADGSVGPADGAARSGAVITVAGDKNADDDEDDAIRPLPDRLVPELTAHRTLALRDPVAQQPKVALTLLLHRLVIDTF